MPCPTARPVRGTFIPPDPDPAPQVHLVDPAGIDADALPRDRTTLDDAALAELETSILLTGLRQPVELWAFHTPRDGGQHYGLISGLRRLTAFRQLHRDAPDARIPAFIRQPADIPDAMATMIAENEIRAPVSPWEKGRLVVRAADDGIFDTLDAAVAGLYPTLDRHRRARIRAVAEVVAEIGDGLLTHPEALKEYHLTRIAAALRQGFGPLIRGALQQSADDSPAGQWTLLRPIVEEAEHDARRPRTGYRPGRPRRMIRPRRGLWIRRERTAEGWSLRFTGPDATGPLMEDIMDHVERDFGRAD